MQRPNGVTEPQVLKTMLEPISRKQKELDARKANQRRQHDLKQCECERDFLIRVQG